MVQKPDKKPSNYLSYRSPEHKNYPIFDDEDELLERLKSMGAHLAKLPRDTVLRLINRFNDEYHEYLQTELVGEFYENIGDPVMFYRAERMEERPSKKVGEDLEKFIRSCMDEDNFNPDLSKIFRGDHDYSIIYNRACLIELSDGHLISANAILDELGRCYEFRFLPVYEKGFFEKYRDNCRKPRNFKGLKTDSEGVEYYYKFNMYDFKSGLEENEEQLRAQRRGETALEKAPQEKINFLRELLNRLFKRK